jgi:phospholipid/cholesterol/gamma-HCH transport system substrate-binding protein
VYYRDHQDELYGAVTALRQTVGDLMASTGPAIDKLKGLQDQMNLWLGPDGMTALRGGTIMASDVCVPTPGVMC